jgi:NADPH:quinone reductase-like Zn-dependent oxidoreductase
LIISISFSSLRFLRRSCRHGLLRHGKLHPVLDETFALRDARRAHERMEQGEFFGKIILLP